MPRLGPIRRADLIHYLQQVGFTGPYPGGKHQYLVKGRHRVWVPNPHQGDISREFLTRILRQARIDRDEWERL